MPETEVPMKFIFAIAILLIVLSAKAQIVSPIDFILDSHPSSLRFVGKKLMTGSISIKSCVFENAKVVVIYGNCTKKEAPATNIRILSRTGGMVTLTIENTDATERRGSISTLTRSNYDGSWSVSYKLSPAFNSENLETIDAIASGHHDLCYTSADLQPFRGTPGYGKPVTGCSGILRSQTEDWRAQGLSFWEEPGKDWYQFLKIMREITSQIP
jgi:hypothetical protein